jgi:hypothetical protein
VYYTATADDNSTQKIYKVTITNEGPNSNTGILDFWVTNVPNAKVVVGQKARQDGKIPIVIQVPYGTGEKTMIAGITLSNPLSQIHPVDNSTAPADGAVIPFANNGNPKEAVYRVTAQDNVTTQDYVAVVSEGGQYYYVDGKNGRDDWPDYYNGETEGRAFKTLAHAVAEAAKPWSTISKIFLLSDLTAAEGGDSGSSDSAFTLDLTSAANKKITVTSTTGATLRGASGRRVLTVKGGAELSFENISITGGNTTGNGGGIYVTGNSKVKFSGGSITGNTAASGGGVFIEDSGSGESEFSFMGGEISGNTATSATAGNTAATLGSMGGGGGVCVKGKATFWLAGGTITNNTANGAGGGILVNGAVEGGTEYGFLMSGGKIVKNETTSRTFPHGGGGAYVAHGAFEMLGGEITGNLAARQGGGVFIHWGDARFTASGNSTITGNTGVGSSAAICNRGTTELMANTRADKVYIWNNDSAQDQSFTLTPGTQISGIALAYSAGNKNFITLSGSSSEWSATGTGPICTIDLESHLSSSGSFAGQLEPDWLGKKIITGNNATLTAVLAFHNRLPLNSFTGTPSVYNMGDHYKINVASDAMEGTFAKK